MSGTFVPLVYYPFPGTAFDAIVFQGWISQHTFKKEAQYPAMDINGIDVTGLRSAIGSVEKDPALGHYTFSVMTTWKGGARSSTMIRGFTIEADEPVGLLGSNTAPNR
jgi:hypothetical protein